MIDVSFIAPEMAPEMIRHSLTRLHRCLSVSPGSSLVAVAVGIFLCRAPPYNDDLFNCCVLANLSGFEVANGW